MKFSDSNATLLLCLVAVLGIGLLPVGAHGFPSTSTMHGQALATTNDEGHLIIALDRYLGPNAPEDGSADRVIVFAPDSGKPVKDIASLLSETDKRVNLDLTESYDQTVLRLNVPGVRNVWLTVPKQRPDQQDQPAQDRHRGMIKGKALSVMDVSEEKQTLEEALSAYRDFPILGGGGDGIEPQDSWCAAGGYCSSSCSIDVGAGGCSVTCLHDYYACCTWNGCRCNIKNGTDPLAHP